MRWRINLLCFSGALIGVIGVVLFGFHDSRFYFYLLITLAAFVTPLAGILQIIFLIITNVIFIPFFHFELSLMILSNALIGLSMLCPMGPGYHFKFSLNPLKWPKYTITKYSVKINREAVETRSFYDRLIYSNDGVLPVEKAHEVDSTPMCHKCGRPAELGYDLCESCRMELEEQKGKRKCRFCEADIAPNETTCDSCGMQLYAFEECPKCNSMVPGNYHICPICGTYSGKGEYPSTSRKAKKCFSCERFVRLSERTCPYCWQKLKGRIERVCSICGHSNPPDQKICEICKYNMKSVRRCSSCGKKTPKEYEICVHCGSNRTEGQLSGKKCSRCDRYYPDGLKECPYCWHDSA